jgi:arylformamidase
MKIIIDISMPLTEDTPVWPKGVKFGITWLKNIKKNGVNESSLSFNTHTGTHLDVPYHFLEMGKRVGEIPLKNLVGKTLVVEYTGEGDIAPDFLNTLVIPSGCNKILFKTLNSLIRDAEFRQDFIALSVEGAEWIVQKGIDLVGIDYLSIQRFDDTLNRTHKVLLKNNVLILEGLCLSYVEKGIYTLFALPLNIPDAEGAPVRAILVMEENS